MDILQSKLAQHNGALAKEIKDLLTEAEKLGASRGAQRLELICDQYDKVSPDIAYYWIDPSAFEREIEEAQSHSKLMEIIHFFRNVFSLAPLITTWAALFHAVDKYQRDLAVRPSDNTIPFLQLWQSGFHGATWVTFTVAAGADVVLLFLYLIFILLTNELDRRAYTIAVNFTQKMRATTEKLVEVIAAANVTPLRTPADIDKVALAVKKAVDSAVDMSKQLAHTTEQSITQLTKTTEQSIKQITQATQQAITDASKKTEDLFVNRMIPMLNTFDTNTRALQTELGRFQTRLNDLTTVTQQLAGASATLVQNANNYASIGQDISTKVAALNATQQGLVTQLNNISGNIGNVAGNMTTATTAMETASKSVTAVAQRLDTGMQTTITQLTENINRATRSLGQTENQLAATSSLLYKAAQLLSSLRFSGGGSSGLIPWLFKRGSNRAKGTGEPIP